MGWSIVDYALRRKIAYYGVRRAFSPIRLILRQEKENVIAVGCNDAPEPVFLEGMLGYMAFDGSSAQQRHVRLEIPAGRERRAARSLAAIRRPSRRIRLPP